jgi:hypothetical protein
MSTRRRERPPSAPPRGPFAFDPDGGKPPLTWSFNSHGLAPHRPLLFDRSDRPISAAPTTARIRRKVGSWARAEKPRHEQLKAGAGSSVPRTVRQEKCSSSAHPQSNPPATKDDRPSASSRSRTPDDQRLRWSSPRGAPPDSNRRPHPYHVSPAHRLATLRFPSSLRTVVAQLWGGRRSPEQAVKVKASPGRLPARVVPRIVRPLALWLERCLRHLTVVGEGECDGVLSAHGLARGPLGLERVSAERLLGECQQVLFEQAGGR